MDDSDNYQKAMCVEDNNEHSTYSSRKENNNGNLIGISMNNEEETYKLYKDYAIRMGFSVRKSVSRYLVGTKDICQKEYCCSKHGAREEKNPLDTRHRNRLKTRSGCEAMLRFTVKNSIWTVTKFVSTHNHELASPSECHLLKSNRELTLEKANVINTMLNAGLRKIDAYAFMSVEVGGNKNVGFTKRDCYNYVNRQKMTLIEAGDAQSLLNHFKLRNAEDAIFFYAIQVDQENRMTNFFWRDARSIINYDFFGDVVVFDTTYCTNRYNLICAPFVGVNHHWQNVMFGCVFLLDETTSSFIWLFKSFLESMGGKAPKTIITDQDKAMVNAIQEVFPNTSHHLCLWHIAKNAPSHLGNLNSNHEFQQLFQKCLKGCESEVEFQQTWDEMIVKFDLKELKWLNKLYDDRQKWCAGLNRDFFSGEFKASQRSESTNHVLNGLANKTTSLSKFVLAFENLVADWRSVEASQDLDCKKGVHNCAIETSSILNHAANVYTIKIFKLSEKEFLNSVATTSKEKSRCNNIFTFEVTAGATCKFALFGLIWLLWKSIAAARNLKPWAFYVHMYCVFIS